MSPSTCSGRAPIGLLLPQLPLVVVDLVAVLDEMVVITARTRDDSTGSVSTAPSSVRP
ncbi:hypothetical protein [Streptomyces sp. NPDC001401]|uniref:hypothetical protein n=1 Tax=Streptomyces sp. NPDC001401 TaxID=3364570 RepID=UPI00367E4AE5